MKRKIALIGSHGMGKTASGADPGGDVEEVPRNASRWRYFPRRHMHMLGQSKGCLVMLIAGPWQQFWSEIKDGRVRTLAWGRKVANVND